jgi:hypothetical protein
MKKRLTVLLMLLMIISAFPAVTYAGSVTIEKDRNNPGYYFETEIISTPVEVIKKDSGANAKASMKTVMHKKTLNYKNSAGKVMWYVKVTGTFTYGNGKATCTKSEVSAASKNKNWKIINKSASKSGNKAKANATARLYQSGVPKQTLKRTVTLTCSPSGKPS